MAQPESSPRTSGREVRRPNIALEVARISTLCHDLATTDRLPVRTLVDAVTKELSRVALATSDQYRAPQCADVAVAALVSHTSSSRPLRERTALRTRLTDLYLATTSAVTLDAVVAEMTLDGLDGDALCWAVILLETTHHTRLIWLQANRIARASTNVNPSDLLGWGWQGLRMALRNYDPTSFAFSTYACTRINGAIRDGIRREGPVPKRLTTYVRRVTAAEDTLVQRLGRTPSLPELAAHLDSTIDQLTLAARCAPVTSLDARLEFNTAEEAAWTNYAETDPAQLAVGTAFADAFESALGRLPREDAEAVRLLVVEERPMPEVRTITGATARQLRQRCTRGKARLAELLVEWNQLAPAV